MDGGRRVLSLVREPAALISGTVSYTHLDVYKRQVDIKLIRSWPNRVVKPLYDAAREISEIDAEDDLPTLKKRREELDRQIKQVEGTSAKNELSGTLDGSDYPES